MVLFEKLRFMVSMPLSLRMAVKMTLQALSRDVPRPAVGGAEKMRIRRHSAGILEMAGMTSCDDLKIDPEHMSRARNIVHKPPCSRKEERAVSETVSKGSSASLSTCSVRQDLWDGRQLADCAVCKRTEFLTKSILVEVRGLSHCMFRATPIAVK